ncbi:MAG: HAMP domain-containing protein [Caldilineaceae bacterium]|nr:HAMP domain-containing protein [Caldilineaceae bacterium]
MQPTMIEPQRQSLLHSLRFLLGIVAVVALTLLLFVTMMQPVLAEFSAMTVLLSITAGISLLAGLAAYHFGWFQGTRRLHWTLVGGYLLSGVLTFVNVLVTAWQMFINAHDRTLATILLIFATSIAVVIGYFLSAALTDKINALRAAARAIANGELDTRVRIPGQDEVSELAESFNNMAVQLESAAAKQREVETLRRELVAWVGHDLRTPLTSVRAIVEALADGMVDDPATAARYLRTAKRDIYALSLLIDNLFEMAQIDAGGLQLERQPNSLNDLVSDTLESFRTLADEKAVTLQGHVTPDVDPVEMDARLIGRVLANLISNALRHSQRGGSVQVYARSVAGGVEVSVRDTGEGIRPEDLPHIFDQFYRGEKSRSRATGGAGLGLAIARSFIEAHGGTIRAESKVGSGTRFIFFLPKGPTAAFVNPLRPKATPAIPTPAPRPRRKFSLTSRARTNRLS